MLFPAEFPDIHPICGVAQEQRGVFGYLPLLAPSDSLFRELYKSNNNAREIPLPLALLKSLLPAENRHHKP